MRFTLGLVLLLAGQPAHAGLFNFPDFSVMMNDARVHHVKVFYITRGFTGYKTEDCILKGVDACVKVCTAHLGGGTESLGWTIGHSAIVVMAYDENGNELGQITYGYGAGADRPEDFAWSLFDLDGSERVVEFSRHKFPCLKTALDNVMSGMANAPYWPFAFSLVGSENCHTAADKIWNELRSVSMLSCSTQQTNLFTVASVGGSGILGYFSRGNLYTYSEAVAACQANNGRIPTLKEIEASNFNRDDFNNEGCIWSSDTLQNTSFGHLFVFIDSGQIAGGTDDHECKVLCIKNSVAPTDLQEVSIEAPPPPPPGE
ncbi:MAG: hypothetical protein KDD39_08020 [Bdellovibrionales bacterium]|nr:hypothetical protein [Bdellovibrionales bacterium]